MDIIFGGWKERFSTQSKFVTQREELQENAFEKVRHHTKSEQKRQKDYYDKMVHPSCKDVGDCV